MSTLIILFNITLVVTPLIVLLLLFAPVLNKRYGASGRRAMWMIVAAALCLPLAPSFIPEPVVLIDVQAPGMWRTNYSAETAVQNAVTVVEEVYVELAAPEASQTAGAYTYSPNAEYSGQAAASGGSYSPSSRFVFNWPTVFGYLWLAGALFSLFYYIINHLIFISAINRSRAAVTDEGILQIFNTERVRLGILQEIKLERSAGVRTPMLVGLINSSVLLPDADCDTEDLSLIIRHELTHFKRHDLWYKLALTFVKCLHWFNPAVRLMVKNANKDIETACDSLTVNGMDIGSRKKYSEVILSMAAGSNLCRSQFTTCMNGGKNMLRQRFSNILDSGKKNGALMFVMLGAVLFASGILVGFNFSPKKEETAEYAGAVYMNNTASASESEQTIPVEDLKSNKTEAEAEMPAGLKDAYEEEKLRLELALEDEKARLEMELNGKKAEAEAALAELEEAYAEERLRLEAELNDEKARINLELQAGLDEMYGALQLDGFSDMFMSEASETGWEKQVDGYVKIGEWYGNGNAKAVKVDVTSADVFFKISDDPSEYTLSAESDEEFYAKTEDGVMSILIPRKAAAEKKHQPLTVTVPVGKALDYVIVEAGSGKVSLNGIDFAGDVTVNAGSGDVTAYGLSVAGDVTVGTGSGNISLRTVNAEGDFYMNSGSGGVDIGESTAANALIATAGGDTKLTGVSGTDTIEISSAGGGKEINNCEFKSMSLSSASGSNKLTLDGSISDYDVSFSSLSGSLTLNGKSADGDSLRSKNASKTIGVSSTSGGVNIVTKE